jgi:hypothetical protein
VGCTAWDGWDQFATNDHSLVLDTITFQTDLLVRVK